MKTLLRWWRGHGTKMIGVVQGLVATLAGVAGLIPASHLKYWLAVSAVLTYWRGFVNSQIANTQLPSPESVARDHDGLR